MATVTPQVAREEALEALMALLENAKLMVDAIFDDVDSKEGTQRSIKRLINDAISEATYAKSGVEEWGRGDGEDAFFSDLAWCVAFPDEPEESDLADQMADWGVEEGE